MEISKVFNEFEVALWSLIKGALKLNRELERTHPTRHIEPLPSDDDNDDWNRDD